MVKGLSPAEEDREMEKRLISDKGSLNYLYMMSCEVRQLAQTWRHDTHHNDIQYNNTLRNDIQHKGRVLIA